MGQIFNKQINKISEQHPWKLLHTIPKPHMECPYIAYGAVFEWDSLHGAILPQREKNLAKV